MTLKELFEKYDSEEDYIIEKLDEKIEPEIVEYILSCIEDNSFTMEEVQKAVSGMKNVDGTSGEHWTMEQTNSVYDSENLEYNKLDFYYILNMMYSDYSDVFGDDTKVYVRLAKNWLDDPDVAPFKAKKYYKHIVLGK